jgi:hypothetical protein
MGETHQLRRSTIAGKVSLGGKKTSARSEA